VEEAAVQMEQQPAVLLAALTAVCTAAALALKAEAVRLTTELVAQSVLFGQEPYAVSHQQIQVICNGTIYSYC
jgi:hypothetical protein